MARACTLNECTWSIGVKQCAWRASTSSSAVARSPWHKGRLQPPPQQVPEDTRNYMPPIARRNATRLRPPGSLERTIKTRITKRHSTRPAAPAAARKWPITPPVLILSSRRTHSRDIGSCDAAARTHLQLVSPTVTEGRAVPSGRRGDRRASGRSCAASDESMVHHAARRLRVGLYRRLRASAVAARARRAALRRARAWPGRLAVRLLQLQARRNHRQEERKSITPDGCGVPPRSTHLPDRKRDLVGASPVAVASCRALAAGALRCRGHRCCRPRARRAGRQRGR